MTLRNIGRGDVDGERNSRRFEPPPAPRAGQPFVHFGRPDDYDAGLMWVGALCSDAAEGVLENQFFRVNCPACVKAAEVLYLAQRLHFAEGYAKGGPDASVRLDALRAQVAHLLPP